MTMQANDVVDLCRRGAVLIREDLALIDSGVLKLQLHGQDVTGEEVGRIRVVLSYLQEIIDGCGCDCA